MHPADLVGGYSDLEMTWLLYCAGAATGFRLSDCFLVQCRSVTLPFYDLWVFFRYFRTPEAFCVSRGNFRVIDTYIYIFGYISESLLYSIAYISVSFCFIV